MKNYCLIISLLIILLACKKEKEGLSMDLPTSTVNGVLILNEGNWHMNNAGLSWFDNNENKVYQDYFVALNNRRLGELGNDALLYGDKVYLVLSGSHLIEVLDKKTLLSVSQIKFENNGTGRTPRRMTADNGKLYVSCFDGTVAVVDTLDLSINKIIKVGKNPEGLAVQNGKLYVANSGGLDFPNYDSTVSVIDLQTLNVVNTITVGLNPASVIAGNDGFVYVLSRGNHKEIEPFVARVNAVNQEKVDTLSFDVTRIEDGQDHLVVINAPEEDIEVEVSQFNYFSNKIIPGFKTSSLKTFFGLSVDPQSGNYFCMDAMEYREPGKVFQFTPTGDEISVVQVGMLPNECLFIN